MLVNEGTEVLAGVAGFLATVAGAVILVNDGIEETGDGDAPYKELIGCVPEVTAPYKVSMAATGSAYLLRSLRMYSHPA